MSLNNPRSVQANKFYSSPANKESLLSLCQDFLITLFSVCWSDRKNSSLVKCLECKSSILETKKEMSYTQAFKKLTPASSHMSMMPSSMNEKESLWNQMIQIFSPCFYIMLQESVFAIVLMYTHIHTSVYSV